MKGENAGTTNSTAPASAVAFSERPQERRATKESPSAKLKTQPPRKSLFEKGRATRRGAEFFSRSHGTLLGLGRLRFRGHPQQGTTTGALLVATSRSRRASQITLPNSPARAKHRGGAAPAGVSLPRGRLHAVTPPVIRSRRAQYALPAGTGIALHKSQQPLRLFVAAQQGPRRGSAKRTREVPSPPHPGEQSESENARREPRESPERKGRFFDFHSNYTLQQRRAVYFGGLTPPGADEDDSQGCAVLGRVPFLRGGPLSETAFVAIFESLGRDFVNAPQKELGVFPPSELATARRRRRRISELQMRKAAVR